MTAQANQLPIAPRPPTVPTVPPAPQHPNNTTHIGIDLPAFDGAAVVSGSMWLSMIAWIAYERLIKAPARQAMLSLTEPLAEERRLNQLLAQIGVLCGVTRVSLGIFHNGELGVSGYHFLKFSITNTYSFDGDRGPMYLVEVPLGKIVDDIEALIVPKGAVKVLVVRRDDPGIKDGCKDYLIRHGIYGYMMTLLDVRDVHIGLLALQAANSDELDKAIKSFDDFNDTLETLLAEVSAILRLRLSRPSTVSQIRKAVGKIGVLLNRPN